ncbi:RICIN domain-containing protein [Acidobacteriota bacterium]
MRSNKKISNFAAFPLLIVACALTLLSKPTAADVLPNGIYTIQQKSNGRFVDAYGSRTRDYMLVTRTQQADDSQKWILNRMGNNEYTIQQKSNGRYVDAYGSRTRDYMLVTRTQQDDDSQKWLLNRVGNNEYTIQQKSNGRYVDAYDDGSKDYRLVTREAQNNDSQKWIFKLADQPAAKLDPYKNGITVLTYNTHLFKGSSAESGRWLTMAFTGKELKRIVFDDDPRAKHIVNRIKESGADIVALQEVWEYDRQRWFRNMLKGVYPYTYLVSEKQGRWQDLMSKDFYKEAIKTSSGQFLVSKYRLSDLSFSPFPRERGSEHDSYATKGIISATVVLPNGQTFRLGATHACTNVGGKDMADIKDLVNTTVGNRKSPAIMMGDLNVPKLSKRSEAYPHYAGLYDQMKNIFKTKDAIDAYRKIHGDSEKNAYTVSWNDNKLHQKFSDNKAAPRCLDYIFVREGGDGWQLIPQSAEVIRNWTYGSPDTMDLSDHYPLKVKFRVVVNE